jgi:hypothetical protein
VRGRSITLQFVLIAAMLGLPALGTPATAAQPLDAQENSVQGRIESIIAYLRSETQQAATAVARLARKNKGSLAAARPYLESQYEAWCSALSDQKAGVTTLGRDATAIWEAWRATTMSSWARIERQVNEALDWIATWMRNQSLPEQPGTPV